MLKKQLFNSQQTPSNWSRVMSLGVLVFEATIATIVLSIFVSSPKLFTTNSSPRPTEAAQNNSPPLILSIRLPQ